MKYLYFYAVTKINKLINKIPTVSYVSERQKSFLQADMKAERIESEFELYRVPPSTMGRRHDWEPIRMKKNQNAFNFHLKTIVFTKSPGVTNWVVC